MQIRCFRSVLFGLVAFSSITAAAQVAGRLSSIKLLTPDTGWASSESALFWTTDAGGHWKNITPRTASPEEIASVFFLDGSTGWVLLSGGEDASGGLGFDLASTSSAGMAWSITQIRIPDLDAESTTLAGGGRIDFVDSLHGWVNLNVVSSSNFRSGLTLRTNDGGQTWNWLPEDPGIAGSIRFVNALEGWLAGGPADQDVYGTRDSGNSWRKLSLQAPEQVYPATYPTYSLPVFENSQHGFLPVTYSGPAGAHAALVLFATDDGGKTWKVEKVLPSLENTSPGQKLPSAVADSALVTAAVTNHTRLATTMVTPNGKSSAAADVLSPDSAILELSFADSSQGWILTSDGRLQSTHDGGVSWSNITPRSLPVAGPSAAASASLPDESAASDVSPFPLSGPDTVVPATAATVHVSRHLGFDAACAPLASFMKTWWTFSPYFDVGIYIGGVNQHNCCPPKNPPPQCKTTRNPNLDSKWVKQVASYGWGFMPLWVGPQEPHLDPTTKKCATNLAPIIPSIAKSQGIKEANKAKAAASLLGLAGTIIYYDLEQYDPSKCGASGAAATAFISGWVRQLHSSPRYSAGVYGDPGNAQTDWSHASPLPDDVWITKPGTNSPTSPVITIWSPPPPSKSASPLCDSSASSCALWLKDQRIKQYLTDQANATFHGTPPLGIDNDVEDATVAGATGSKTYNYCSDVSCYFRFDHGKGTYTHFHFINDVGQIVGVYVDASGVSHGFLRDSDGKYYDVDCGAPGSSSPEAINNAGQVVGADSDPSGNTQGFLWTIASKCQSLPDSTGAADTHPRGLNDAGWISGAFQFSSTTQPMGFIYYQGVNMFSSSIDYFGGDGTVVAKINGAGRTAGWDPVSFTSFVGYGTCPTCRTLLPPIGAGSSAITISNNDDIAGTFADATGVTGGFVYNYDSRSYTVLSFPGAKDTAARSINDLGQVVGWYTDSVGDHAFMACPEPQFVICVHAP
jgi:probable HAF family extracellular repeat protein